MADVDRAKYSEHKQTYHKEVYNWRKAHKICVYCGHEEAQNGHLMCLQCRMKTNESRKRYYYERLSTEQRYKQKQYKKRRYDLLRAFGVCVCCQKRDVAPGKTMCPICLAKKKRQYKEQRIKHGGRIREMLEYSGGCCFCGEPVLTGKKVCRKHYDILMANLKKVNGCINRENHPFRLDNEIAFRNYDKR